MGRVVVVPLLDPQVDHIGVSERALPYARRLVETTDADLLLVSVVDIAAGYSEEHGGLLDDPEHASWIDELQQYLASVARRFPEDRVTTRVLRGNVTRAVLELIDTLDRPMLVMGSHARTGGARTLYGSVAFRILHSADAPALMVSKPLPVPADIYLQRVMVPLDGSVFGEQVLESAIDALGQQDLHFHLVHVIDVAHNPPDGPLRKFGLTPYQWAKGYLPKVAEALESRGYGVSWEIRDGTVPEEITAASDERGVDLIAMSTNSRGGISRLIYGSVAETVLSTASVPLLLVRPGETAVPFGA